MSSLFYRLYKYRQSDKRNSKENFLTEIFAYCLQNDSNFRHRFLNLIKCDCNCSNFSCETQFVDHDFGRPDLYITIDEHTTIVIECKVDSKQEVTQLSRYSSFLKKSKTVNNRLIFLTKFYENSTSFESDPRFLHIRWYQVFELLNDTENIVSKELSKYLIEQKMDSKISFTTSDIMAISFINENIKNMDAFLNRLCDILERYSDNKVNRDKSADLLNLNQYGVKTEYKEGSIWVGFYQYEHNDQMQICVDFTVPKTSKKLKAIVKQLEINNWEWYDNENNTREWYINQGLSSFIENNVFQIEKASDFIEIGVKLLQPFR